jgi:nickel transport protein
MLRPLSRLFLPSSRLSLVSLAIACAVLTVGCNRSQTSKPSSTESTISTPAPEVITQASDDPTTPPSIDVGEKPEGDLELLNGIDELDAKASPSSKPSNNTKAEPKPSPSTNKPAETNPSASSTSPEARLIRKLTGVPVFTVANAQGNMLTATVENKEKKQSATIAPVFLDPQDAQAFIDNNKAKEQFASVQVVPLPLSEVYKLQKENKNKTQPLVFEFIPAKQQVDAAVSILKQQGQTVDKFAGVPLFVGREKGKAGLMIISIKDQSVVPFFFDKGQLEAALTEFKARKPNAKLDNIEIGVVSLASFADQLLKKNDAQLDQVVLVPTQESIEYVKTHRQTAPSPTP